MDFTVTKHAVNDGVTRLAVSGEVDLATAEILRRAILDAITVDRVAELIVDLDAVTFMDSTGVATLVAGRNAAIDRGTAYQVTNARKLVRKVLSVVGVLEDLTGASLPPDDLA